MHSSSTDGPGRRAPGGRAPGGRAPGGRGTWLRLAVLVLLVALLALAPAPGRTGALLTDTTHATTVVSTLPEFPAPADG